MFRAESVLPAAFPDVWPKLPKLVLVAVLPVRLPEKLSDRKGWLFCDENPFFMLRDGTRDEEEYDAAEAMFAIGNSTIMMATRKLCLGWIMCFIELGLA